MHPVFAEADPMGWLLQGGALALLAYIVAVLYPRISKDTQDERVNRDKTFVALVDVMHGKFEERNAAIVNSIKDQTLAVMSGQTNLMAGILSAAEAARIAAKAAADAAAAAALTAAAAVAAVTATTAKETATAVTTAAAAAAAAAAKEKA